MTFYRSKFIQAYLDNRRKFEEKMHGITTSLLNTGVTRERIDRLIEEAKAESQRCAATFLQCMESLASREIEKRMEELKR